jgi:hypothetical protein
MDPRVSEILISGVEPIEPMAACAHILHETAALISYFDVVASPDLTDRRRDEQLAHLLVPVARTARGAILSLRDDPFNAAPLDGPRVVAAVQEAMTPFEYGADETATQAVLRSADVSYLVRSVGGVTGSLGPGHRSPEDAQSAFVGVIAASAVILGRCSLTE